ncbi:MAG: hypothetical protein WKI04_09565 [Ferruginibacter sp.]
MSTEKNKPFNDDETEKRIHEHLSNEKDVISDKDIENVNTEIGTEGAIEQAIEEEDLPEREKNKKPGNSNNGDDEEPRIETAWNILS